MRDKLVFLHSRFLSTPRHALGLTDLGLVLRNGWEGTDLNTSLVEFVGLT